MVNDLNAEYLLDFLNDGDKDIRVKTAWILGEIGEPELIQPLFDLLMTDTYQEVKESTADALSKIGGKEVVELLVVALHDSDWYIRKVAAYALGNLQDPYSIEPLKKLLVDDNTFVKRTAKEALKKFQE